MAAQENVFNSIKRIDPLTYIPLAGSVFTITGGLSGWYVNSLEIASTSFTQIIDGRTHVVLVIGIISLVLTLAAYVTKLYNLSILNILISSFALIYTLKSRPDSVELSLLEITTSLGYWLCLFGLAAVVFGSFMMLIAGAPSKANIRFLPRKKLSVGSPKKKTKR